VISDEAVEAAARAWVQRHAQPGSWTVEENLRAALAAAAPFIAAQAWDEGWRSGIFRDGNTNPYRSGT
jgi:hypothetical protein